MADFGRTLRTAGARLLDYDTQQRLLQRKQGQDYAQKTAEQERKLAADAALDERRLRAGLARELRGPAGVAATRSILGNEFDPQAELDFRRVQEFLKPQLDAGQYETAGREYRGIGGRGEFAPSEFEVARTETERSRTARDRALEKQAQARTKAIQSDIGIKMRDADQSYAKTIADLTKSISAGKAPDGDMIKKVDSLQGIADFYEQQLYDLKRLPDYYGDEDSTQVNEKYAKRADEIEKKMNAVRNKRQQLYDVILESTGQAQQVDRASGGAVAGGAAGNLRERLALELLKKQFPQLYQEYQKAKAPTGSQEQVKNGGSKAGGRDDGQGVPQRNTLEGMAKSLMQSQENKPKFKWE